MVTLNPLGWTSYTGLPASSQPGRYEFKNVPPGSYTVEASGESYPINAFSPGNYQVPDFAMIYIRAFQHPQSPQPHNN